MDAWDRLGLELEVKVAMGHLDAALFLAELLDMPVLGSPRPYDWKVDGDGHDSG